MTHAWGCGGGALPRVAHTAWGNGNHAEHTTTPVHTPWHARAWGVVKTAPNVHVTVHVPYTTITAARPLCGRVDTQCTPTTRGPRDQTYIQRKWMRIFSAGCPARLAPIPMESWLLLLVWLPASAGFKAPLPRMHSTRCARIRCSSVDEGQASKPRFAVPFLQPSVPEDQQPVAELQDMRRQPFYDWPMDDKYNGRLFGLWRNIMLVVSLPQLYNLCGICRRLILARGRCILCIKHAIRVLVWFLLSLTRSMISLSTAR